MTIIHFPTEILFTIFEYFSPQDKRFCALVCKRFQMIAEHSNLLFQDIKEGKNLSMRQLSILFNNSPQQKNLQVRIVLLMLSQIESLLISEKRLLSILNLFDDEYFNLENFCEIGWIVHFERLFKLEEGYRKSPDFLIESAVYIFFEHLKFMQTKKFKINGFCGYPDRAIHQAAKQKSNVLIQALALAGANVNSFTYKVPRDESLVPLSYLFIPPHNREERYKCLESLLRHGAKPNKGDSQALWFALKISDEVALQILVDLGKAHLDAFINFGKCRTILQVAANSGNLAMVQKLIALGAHPEPTAEKLAKEKGYKKIAHFIKQSRLKK